MLPGILIRLVTGASWVDIEAIMNFEVSDTTLRARRDEWVDAGVFDQLEAEARAGYDRIIELDLDVVAIDGSLHKAPCGGEGTGKSPVDRGKLGWKWSVASERTGIPIAWSIDGANRNDVVMLEPTLDAIVATGLLADIGTVTLDRGYDYPAIRARLYARGLIDSDIQRRGTKPRPVSHTGSRSGCAGSSKQPTRGGRTTGNSAATPTASPPPPCRLATRHRSTDRRPPDRLPQPLEPRVTRLLAQVLRRLSIAIQHLRTPGIARFDGLSRAERFSTSWIEPTTSDAVSRRSRR